jgi:hypothetical protein
MLTDVTIENQNKALTVLTKKPKSKRGALIGID